MIWVPWPVPSGGGMDGHGQARTDTDRLVEEYGISQDPQLVMPIPDTADVQTPGRGIHPPASLRDVMNGRAILIADRPTGKLVDRATGRPANRPTGKPADR